MQCLSVEINLQLALFILIILGIQLTMQYLHGILKIQIEKWKRQKCI